MKKINLSHIACFVMLLGVAVACKKTTVAPVSERIAKAWTANIVKHGSTTVYTKGSTSTIAGYSSFRLNLSSATSVSLTEFDGNTFTGQWEVSADEKTLTLKNLSPQPTGTGGTISYSIVTIEDTKLNLVRTSASQKTGGTINDYALVNP